MKCVIFCSSRRESPYVFGDFGAAKECAKAPSDGINDPIFKRISLKIKRHGQINGHIDRSVLTDGHRINRKLSLIHI